MEQSYMKTKKILPLVLSMSLPMVLSMLVNSLYNIVDSYFVARISDEAMTALSLVYPIQILVNSVAVGFGIGINSAAAYFLGAKNHRKANDIVSSGIVLSLVHSILFTIFTMCFTPYFIGLFTENTQVLAYSLKYAYIVFAFTIPNIIAITFEKIFQAEGQMNISMISMLCGCIVNIILDPLMIFGIGPFPEMGITGAALATGIGQVVPLIAYIAFYLKKPLPLRIKFHSGMFDKSLCGRMYRVGIPAALNTALPSFMITALNGILAVYSDLYVLVLGIYFKLQTFIYLTANGIVQGNRPIIGYNYGAGEHRRVKRIFYTALSLIAGIMVVGTIICVIFAGQLTGLFSSSAETIAIGKSAIRMISMGFLASAVSVTACGALEGLGKGGASLLVSLLRYIIIPIPAAWLLATFAGVEYTWHAFWIGEFITGIAAFILYIKQTQNQDSKN